MKIKAKLGRLRISPRKTRLVADIIRRKKAEEAKEILSFTQKRGAEPILKLLNSAIANAGNNFQIDSKNLYISEIRVDEGIKLKRWRPRARGRAASIKKRVSEVTIILEEINPKAKKLAKNTEKAKKDAGIDNKKEVIEKPIKENNEKAEVRSGFSVKQPARESGPKPKGPVSIPKIFRRKSV